MKKYPTRMEYRLTAEDGSVEQALRERIKCSMPLAAADGARGTMGTLSSEMVGSNAIIHEASMIPGCPDGHIESMTFCVSFLGRDAMVRPGQARVWITGQGMNSLLSHTLKKKKFIFDETIEHKVGWTSRAVHTAQSAAQAVGIAAV